MRLPVILLCALALVLPAVAHADVIEDFSLIAPAVLPVNSTTIFTGTFSFDATTDRYLSVDLFEGSFEYTAIYAQLYESFEAATKTGRRAIVLLDFLAPTDGGNVQIATRSGLYAGSLTEVAATPEPSTLCLIGTGLLGLVAAGRRRFNA